ncbi:two-partner secretion domain-containing protein [Nostoc sp.]|uniref:two-partner secretion domain-containing protein n=1 Tax=Nostoc sp. TaxID=1180 RepID=UPI002FF90687
MGKAPPSAIAPDNTLGAENSKVVTNFNGLPVEVITGGATRGINLFHSFREFNVSEGRSAYFLSFSADIQNILARVTGGNRSEILGRLGTLGESKPNLFLMNPNGIIFGKNASLDLQGSFAATTANAIAFGERGNFSATNPEVPQLLTINPSAFLFSQINKTASIQNNAIAPAGKDPAGIDVFGLRVPDGKSLLLVGGNVSMDGGWAIANGGRIELGSLAEAGSIGIQSNGDNVSLNFPNGVQRGDISLNNRAIVGVIGEGGGSIAANARNLEILAGSQFFAGIGSGLGTANTQAGDITVDATEQIKLAGTDSLIFNSVQSQAVGNAGNITLKTGSFEVTDGAQIDSFTRGRGNAGNITIQAKDAVIFDGTDNNGNKSGLFSVVGDDAIGNGGTVSITSGSLSLNNGGSLGIYVSDALDVLQGKKATGGTANIDVRDAFTISGEGSGIFASLGSGVVGTGGDINIQAGNLFIQDSGEVSSFLASGAEGRSGNINIQAESLFMKNSSEINSSTYGKGNSGNISIATRDAISLDSASYIYNNVQSSDAVGNAGNIDITTGSLKIDNNAGIFAGTFGKGNGGNITVEAKDLVEILSDSNLDSGIAQTARGNAGDITINTRRLIVRNSQIGPSVLGEGNAGNFTIIASESVELSGQISKREGDTSQEGSVGYPGGLLTQIDVLGKGKAGNLTIETSRLSVSDGSKIQAATFGDGDAGNIFIRADEIDLFETEKPNFYSTGIFAGVQTDGRIEAGIIDPRNGIPPKGQGGNLTVETRKLSVRYGAEVFVQTTGEGDAGKIFIRAGESVNVTGVSTGSLERQRTSKITTGASQTSTGNGGSLTIETPLLNVTDGGFISSTSEGTGNAGILTINANAIRLDNQASLNTNTRSPNKDPNREQATINLNTQNLNLRRNSNITANATGENVIGGNINIDTDLLIALENSHISANSDNSRGGQVRINAQGVFVGTQPSDVSKYITATSGVGLSGTVNVNSPDNSAIQNNLTELPTNAIDTNALIANSCIARANKKQENSFIITGGGALPNRPGDVSMSNYSTDRVRGVNNENTSRPWKKGDPILEPTGVYRLSNGQLVMSRECQNN